VGFLCAAVTAANSQDRIYRFLSEKNGDGGRPEYRLVLTQLGMLFLPVGLLIWAWTAQSQSLFIYPLIGNALLGYGLMLAFNSIQAFLVDNFFPYSAAAMAAASFFRSIIGAILPIVAPTMFRKLGWGWGGTVLALIASIIIPAPIILFRWGPMLREKFRFQD